MRFNTSHRLVALAAMFGISLIAATSAVGQVPGNNGIIAVDDSRTQLISTLRWDAPSPLMPFAGPNCCTEPAISPDGQTVAFVSQNEIFTQHIDGSGQRRLTTNDAVDRYPSFSPDGTKIVFSSRRGNFFAIWQMNTNGSNQTQLTSPNDLDPDARIGDFVSSYSPDGKTIAYASLNKTTSGFQIHLMNSDGTNQRLIDNQMSNSEDPSFSPDGKRIAFSGNEVPGDPETSLFTMRTNGTDVEKLTAASGPVQSPSYSPDGKYIAFIGNGNIRVMDASSGTLIRELSSATNARLLAWQPLPRAPICAPLRLTTTVNKPVQGTADCTDPDNESFSFAPGDSPANGSALSDAQGNLQYQPRAGFAGTDTFTLTTTDARGARATVQVTVQVSLEVTKDGGPATGGGKQPTPAAKLSAIGKASKSKKGKFTVTLTCSPGAGSCGGKLVIKSTGKKPKTVASASYSLAPGSSKSIKLKLSNAGRKLQRKGHQKLTAKATAATLNTTLTIKGN